MGNEAMANSIRLIAFAAKLFVLKMWQAVFTVIVIILYFGASHFGLVCAMLNFSHVSGFLSIINSDFVCVLPYTDNKYAYELLLQYESISSANTLTTNSYKNKMCKILWSFRVHSTKREIA